MLFDAVSVLYTPSEHRPLQGAPWSEQAARAAIEEIAADAIAAYGGPLRVWPNAAEDLEGEPDRPFRDAYFGAAGMGWALHRLAADGLAPALPGLAELMDGVHAAYLADPELVAIAPGTGPAPSLLFGESGMLLAADAVDRDANRLASLAEAVQRNARCPTLELCWGSPGTMVAALALWRATGEPPWRELWLDSARWLIDRWEDPIWTQDMYGSRRRFIGAGHGFASNVAALLAGVDLLGDAEVEAIAARAAGVLAALAMRDGDRAQWLPRIGEPPGRIAVQWCHGSPGIVVSLRGLPRDPVTDALLLAGGELTWSAGPLRRGVGLCHGTGGNAYALLALHERAGSAQTPWLARARAFAMDAAADVRRRRAARGRGRYTLFTGDIGVALLLRSCLRADARFPFLDEL